MAILSRVEAAQQKPKIDLSGPNGNAFCLLGYATKYVMMAGKDAGPIRDEMMSGDYENLLEVFDREFGEYVDLVR
jgi:hypothetical protein